MKKKLISVLLVGALVVSMGAIAGCGSSDSSSDSGSAEEEGQETEEEVYDEDPEDTEDVAVDSEEEVGEEAEAEDTTEAASGDYAGATITLQLGNNLNEDGISAVIDLAEQELGITVDVSYQVEGEEGDNLVKTELASGEMTDLLYYNTGALFEALNPSEYFYDLSGDSAIMDRLDDTYKDCVTIDGATYGVPLSCSSSGAVLYNKSIYEEYGLEVPTTWDEFIANCDTLKDAGENALIGSFADDWSTQYPLLGDNANVLAYDPDFDVNFDEGKDTYVDNPYALRSFEKVAQLHDYYNEDYLATTYDDGCDMLASGEGAQWLMGSSAIGNIYNLYGEETANNLGLFAIPADDADKTTLTLWMPASLYVNKDAENIDAVLAFLEFYISDEALDAYNEALLPDGPCCIKGYELPDTAYDAIKYDTQAYLDDGKVGLASEFVISLKGPDCASICQECGSGQTTGEEAAEKYDEDCRLQAQQLGYEWAQ